MKGYELDRHETGGMNCAESTVATNEDVGPLDLDGIYRVHAPDVMHWIARLAGPHADIEDMVHEVFMVVQRRLHQFRGDAKITTWLYRITERIVFDRRRRDRKLRWLGLHRADETGRALNASTPSPIESIERQQSVALVYRILDMGADKSSAGVDGTWLWVRNGDNYLGPNRTAAGLADGSALNPLYLEKLGQMRSIRWSDTLDSASVTEWNTRTQLTDNWLDADRGAPIEVLVEICNRAQVDCWFSIPAQASDGYLRGLAEYLRDHLDPRLIARIEIGDEYWNGRAQYALAQCQARWNVTGWCAAEWAGMRLAQACDIFKNEVFGATERQRVRCVVVAQGGNSGVGKGALECPSWVGEGNQACWQHGFDEYAVSRFFSGNVDTWTSLESQGAAGVEQAVALVAADVTANMAADLAADLDLAQSHGLAFTAYSMGIDLGYDQTGTTAEFRRQVARHPGMQQVYRDMLSRWKALGGTLFHHYVDVRGGDGSAYGLLETVEDDTSRWRAVADWSRTVSCWWPGCAR